MGYLLTPEERAPKRDRYYIKAERAFRRARKAGVDPLIHRIAASTHYSDRLIDIQQQWTAGDIADAHRWLDAIAEASEPEPLDLPG